MCARNLSGSGTPGSTSFRSGCSTGTELAGFRCSFGTTLARKFGPIWDRVALRQVVFLSIPLVLLLQFQGCFSSITKREGVTHEKGQEDSCDSDAERHRNGGSGNEHRAGTRRDPLGTPRGQLAIRSVSTVATPR